MRFMSAYNVTFFNSFQNTNSVLTVFVVGGCTGKRRDGKGVSFS